MTSARWVALVGVLLMVAPILARAQGVPVPQPAPKNRTQPAPAARQQPAPPPSPVQTDSAGRPIPVAPPADSVPYDGSQYPVVQKINNYLSSLQTLIGDFVQIGPDGTRTVGKFYIQKPGRVRFEYDPPSPIDVVADGSSVVVRDRNLLTQDLYPLSQTPLRYLLAEQIDLVHDTNLVAISQDNTFISLTLEERQLLVGTHRMVLMFSTKDLQLRQWTITDPQGYETTVAIYNLDLTHKPDPDMFTINYQMRLQ
jgi:outer membrane lipoprotein-sorting protein